MNFKDYKIKEKYKKNNFTVNGVGKIKLEKEFDKIEYEIIKADKDFNLASDIVLSELHISNQEFLKNYFLIEDQDINLKDHIININYINNNLIFNGIGKIKLEKEFEKIDYSISKNNNKFIFETKLNLNNTALNLDQFNYFKDNKLESQLTLKGTYEKNKELNLEKISILSKDNKIILENFLLDGNNKIIKIDKLDLDYIDNENKKNQFVIRRKQRNNYDLNGKIFNANSLIEDLLESNSEKKSKIFKNNINITLNLNEVFIDNQNKVKDLKGVVNIKDNKFFQTNISALFNKNESFTFTINTNDNDEKITTLFSSKAKPLVKRYKFIKGYEEGHLDFYSSKKDNVSKSKLKIYDFKLQELPILTKLLTLASLQGIADILSGEGIRFDELEMNFSNKAKLMTIDELYAIGPAISILMDGYVEEGKLISLRGTLVPATTINKTISAIPLLGKILVGNKIGEGVFGVSFKIKGPPKKLETTVNPIKTLTPRFITRTLEKIKKN